MSAAPRIAKDLMLAIIRDQPDDSSFDDLLRKLAFHRMVEHGLANVGDDESVTTEELRDRFKEW